MANRCSSIIFERFKNNHKATTINISGLLLIFIYHICDTTTLWKEDFKNVTAVLWNLDCWCFPNSSVALLQFLNHVFRKISSLHRFTTSFDFTFCLYIPDMSPSRFECRNPTIDLEIFQMILKRPLLLFVHGFWKFKTFI